MRGAGTPAAAAGRSTQTSGIAGAANRVRLTMPRTARLRPLAFVAASLLLAACRNDAPKGEAPGPATTPPASPIAVNEAWRAKHESDYRRDWVSIAGLFPLRPGANTAGSAAGNAIVLPGSVPAKVGTLHPQRHDGAVRAGKRRDRPEEGSAGDGGDRAA